MRPVAPGAPAAFVWGLGVTQIIGYGTLFYAFSILAPAMARDLGWSTEGVFGLFSVALLVGGLAAPSVGRWIDRAGAGRVLTIGSALSAGALVAAALLPGPLGLGLGLVAMEAASALVLYDAAFALLVQAAPGQGARRSITHLTLIAGFASTLFWPATAALHEALTWREVLLLFAGLNLGLCLPIHAVLARLARRRQTAEMPSLPDAGPLRADEAGLLPAGHRRRALALVLVGFSLTGFVLSALLVHMVPVLTVLGLGGAAVLVGSLFGPAQVLSRLGTMAAGPGLDPVDVALVSAALVPLSIAVLALSGAALPAAILFALLFGLGSGLTSIVRGTLPLALFGRNGYGTTLGRITAVRLVVTALAPFLFAVVLERAGVAAALWMSAALGLAGAVAIAAVARLAATARRMAAAP